MKFRSSISRLLRRVTLWFLAGCLWLSGLAPASAQTPVPLLKQLKTGQPAQPLTPEELAQLDDPLFNLVLKDHADATDLAAVRQRLQPRRDSAFVVHEEIANPDPDSGRRRAVLTFDGTTAGQSLNQNIFLSTSFDAESFPNDRAPIEAIGWDEGRKQFNYYKLDSSGNRDAPDAFTWKFRGNSQDADLLTAEARQGTCMACHINGGLVMKELFAPWNNWHSSDFRVSYLSRDSRDRWPVTTASESPLNPDNRPSPARFLEGDVMARNAIFNRDRIQKLQDGDRITDAKRLLKPLFVTTEFNLMSSFARAASHPFDDSPASQQDSQQDIDIPVSFFLNSRLLSRALGLSSRDFQNIASLRSKEYQEVVQRSKTHFRGSASPSDTHFAWFTPEASEIDNDFVTRLVGSLVPRGFVAAALSVDLENPVFSSDRRQLWASNDILPTQFRVGESGDLIAQTVQNLERLNPARDAAAGQFLAALRSPDPVQFLQRKIEAYAKREQQRLADPLADPQARAQEIGRLYRKLMERREAIETFELGSLVESPFLLPRADNLAALPEQIEDGSESGGPSELGGPGKPGGESGGSSESGQPTPGTEQPILALGDRGEPVKTLQQTLQTLGFLDGPADGDFGPMTDRAVRSAQRSLRLTVDGVVGPATWSALDRVLARPVLRSGNRGEAVADLQKGLRDRGFFSVIVDGDFGPATRRAVVSLQQRLGLTADGVVGSATWARLA